MYFNACNAESLFVRTGYQCACAEVTSRNRDLVWAASTSSGTSALSSSKATASWATRAAPRSPPTAPCSRRKRSADGKQSPCPPTRSAASGDSRGPNSSLLFIVSQMVIPADPEEMKQFQEQCVAQCQCAVDISLPLAYVLLPSKQAFQSIYNRCGCTAALVYY